MLRGFLVMVLVAVVAPAAQAATFTVNSAADPDPDPDPGDCNATECTLREAIAAANASPNSGGPDLIHFAIGSGAAKIVPQTGLPHVTEAVTIDATTQPAGTVPAGTPRVELSGEVVTQPAGAPTGLTLLGQGSTVRGVAINRFGYGIELAGSGGHRVVGNRIGTDPAGATDLGNDSAGVVMTSGSQNVIGGTTAADRNVLSGNGTPALAGSGIQVAGGSGPVRATVIGNYIGTNADGTGALGNSSAGVFGLTSGIVIGGTDAGAGNTIAFNTGEGVFLNGATLADVTVRGNSIHDNGGLGIDLGPATGVTPNDPLDADTGPNGLQNFPVITSAIVGEASAVIRGTLPPVSGTYQVDVYTSPACDPQNHGEGAVYIGSTAVAANDTWELIRPGFIQSGHQVTATATHFGAGSIEQTSEFSACRTSAGTGVIQIKSVGAGSETAGVPVTLERLSGSAGAQDVTLIPLAGSAEAGADFPQTGTVVHWNAGDSSDRTVTVPVTDDGLIEAAETMSIRLDRAPANSPDAGLGPAPEQVDATIADNDGGVRLGADAVNVGEGAGSVTLTVARTGALDRVATIDFATSNGTAAAGSDYAASSGTVTLAPGEASKTFTVPISQDAAIEPAETFSVSLSGPGGSPGTTVLESPASAVVTIGDDDLAGLPTPPPPPPPPSGEQANAAPDSNIKTLRKRVRSRSLRRFTGTASDPDRNLARVEIALVARTRTRCLRLNSRGRPVSTRRRGACRPVFVRATGTDRWTFRLRRALPPGAYTLRSRAIDRAGARETSFARRDRNLATFTVI